MKKLIALLSLHIACSHSSMAGVVDCFKNKDYQFHFAYGDDQIASFSLTSYAVAKKVSAFLGGSGMFNLPRSVSIDLANEGCQIANSNITCQIESGQNITVFNSWGNHINRDNSLSGFVYYSRNEHGLKIKIKNSADEQVDMEMAFKSSECH